MGAKCYEREIVSLHCRLGGTDSLILVGPKCYKKETVSLQSHLSETDCLNSVRPVSAISKLRIGQANSMGLTAYLGETEITTISNREFVGPSR